MPYAKADAMAKLIPDELGINLTSSWEKEPKIKNFVILTHKLHVFGNMLWHLKD